MPPRVLRFASFTLPRSPRQRRIALAMGVVLGTALMALACALQGPAALLYRLGVGQPYPWADAMSLQSISMVSADEGWAVGHISGLPNTLLMHYQHGQWTILPKPMRLDDTAEFAAISMLSADDGWALVSTPSWFDSRHRGFRPGSLLLHYLNGTWSIASPVIPMGSGTYDPSALLMVSATDGWATGEDKTLHYDGTAWREVTVLSDQQLGGGSSIAATAPNDIWIARFGGDIVHYDGKSWTQQRITLPFGQQLPGPILLQGITMISQSEGFAVGGISNSSSGVILHYTSGRWSVQSTTTEYLYGISLRSASEGWAVGASGGIYHYLAGVWIKASKAVSYPLYGVTSRLSSSDAWAVGLGGALLRYHDGAWQQETNVVWSKEAQDEWQ